MARTLSLGASSLTGKSANALVEEMFGKDKFPLQLLVTNKTPRMLVFPEIRAELKANFNAPENVVEVTFKDNAQLTRFTSDIDALSELNQWADAIDLEEEAMEDPAAKNLSAGKSQKLSKPVVDPKPTLEGALADDSAATTKK